jgi:hypothetical protein
MLPLFFPAPEYVVRLPASGQRRTLARLCEDAGIACRASGPWTQRDVRVCYGQPWAAHALPGDWAAVRLQVPGSGVQGARQALAYLAYGLHDLVARESVRGLPWVAAAGRPGRPRSGRALSGAERQARYRRRRARQD